MFVRTDVSAEAALEERRNIHVEPRAKGEWRKENEKLIVRLGLHKLVIQGRSAPWGARFVPSPHGTKRLYTDRIRLVVYHNLGKGNENPPLLSRHNYQRRCNAVKNKRFHTSWQNHTFSDPAVSAESVVSRGKRTGIPLKHPRVCMVAAQVQPSFSRWRRFATGPALFKTLRLFLTSI